MNFSRHLVSRKGLSGYVSYMLVLTTSAILSLLMLHAYRSAIASHAVQSQVQLRVDYSEKEEAILRSIVAITPNRAIRAMQQDSNASTSNSNPLRWQQIFNDSLELANSRTSISSTLANSLNIPNLKIGNTGDSALARTDLIFKAAPAETGFVSAGINRSLGTGYPPALNVGDSTVTARDALFPIISSSKIYGTLAQGGVGLPTTSYPNFNLLKYPQINFGYAKPGEDFVAKRNWWTFSLDVGGNDNASTFLARSKREFVLSIYEIPSQLAVSASSFMALGKYASGDAWQNVTIDGGMFVGKAEVESNTAIGSLSSRRGLTLAGGATVGGQSFAKSPFTPGVRESYQVTSGAFFPVSQASESGRAAFIPISRGADYFDRFSTVAETNTLSDTTWNNYSIGALQCAMRLDVTQVQGSVGSTPTLLRFGYFLPEPNLTRATMDVPLNSATFTTLPPGYVRICDEGQSYTFPNAVDVAYGASGGFTFRQGLSGTIAFNNATFGNPLVGTNKGGFWRPRAPFEVKPLASGKQCVTVYPQRIPAFLTAIGAANTSVNHSLVVNVDYTVTGLNNVDAEPKTNPCREGDYGVILRECADLTSFTKGFSLVTNLRLYIGDDFNNVKTTPPAGYAPTGDYFPPCSIFSPERRWGVDVDPLGITLGGQIGSLASETSTNPVRPFDSKNRGGNAIAPNRITVNLRPIKHPAELPPITMMNWLVLLEERRKEFY